MARLDSREARIQCEQFSLAELVQDVCQKFQLTVANKGIALKSSFADNLPFVEADIGLIERALENIIHNATRYTASGGTITVSLSHESSSVVIRISDSGCGIAGVDLPHIFDRFYRTNRHINQKEPGSGWLLPSEFSSYMEALFERRVRPTSEPSSALSCPPFIPSLSCPSS